MFIKSIKLLGFRNYLEAVLNFTKNKTIIIGKNAQGKTNLLEVVQILSHGRSRRATKDAELVNFNLQEAFIHAVIENIEQISIAMALRPSGRRTLKINEVSKKPKELIHNLYSVSFMADDLEIVNGSPSSRREWIDDLIIQLERSYTDALDKFSDALSQRNSFLKKLNEKNIYRPQELNIELNSQFEVWDQIFMQAANYITAKRTEYLAKLEPMAEYYYRAISSSDLKFQLAYNGKEISLLDLQDSRVKDLIRGISNLGPQRDEIEIMLKEKLARSFASQGERRTIILALKLAELELIKQTHLTNPILLLDDVLAELDESRQDYLLDTIDKNTQVIITTTHLGKHIEKWSMDSQILEIENGMIKEQVFA